MHLSHSHLWKPDCLRYHNERRIRKAEGVVPSKFAFIFWFVRGNIGSDRCSNSLIGNSWGGVTVAAQARRTLASLALAVCPMVEEAVSTTIVVIPQPHSGIICNCTLNLATNRSMIKYKRCRRCGITLRTRQQTLPRQKH